MEALKKSNLIQEENNNEEVIGVVGEHDDINYEEKVVETEPSTEVAQEKTEEEICYENMPDKMEGSELEYELKERLRRKHYSPLFGLRLELKRSK